MNVDILTNGGVNVEGALEFLGDMETYNSTLQDFLDEIGEKLNKIEEYKNNGDMPNYAINVHSLKSDSKYLGFTDLAQLALDHEMKSKEGDANYVNENYDTLIAELNRILLLIKEYMGNGSVSSEEPKAVVDSENKILVADDSNLVRNFVEKVVPTGYSVLAANDGEEAINYITSEVNSIKGILLDLNMPKVDGFQVLEFLKDNNLFVNIPVIIITGDNTKDTVMKAFDYPIVDVLNKPFTEGDVTSVVTKMINYKSVN